MAEMAALRAVVHGRVQGVFFRAFVEDNAEYLRLTGYVRNRRDGVVEVSAEGEKPDLEKLVERLKQGPPAARVDNVEVEWDAYRGIFSGFNVRV